jgi:hypothetical protein
MIAVIRVTTTGSNGSAAGAATSEFQLRGFLECIKTDFTAQPSTTDVTITEADGMQRTLLTLTSGNTDAVDFPRYLIQDNAGADIAANYTRLWLDGKVTVTVAQGDNNGTVAVYVQVSEGWE